MVMRETNEIDPRKVMEIDCWVGLPCSRHLHHINPILEAVGKEVIHQALDGHGHRRGGSSDKVDCQTAVRPRLG